MLLHIPEVLSADQVQQFQNTLNAANWVDGRASVGRQGGRVKQNLQLPDTAPEAVALGKVILLALQNNPVFFAAALPARFMSPMFNKYQNGGHYGFHVDGAVRLIAGQSQSLRTDVSCTLFLSEPEDYEGGELVVSDTYGEHAVKLPAGDLILYPSSSLHKVEPVTGGTRLASFFWIQSMVADDARRTMLYELDKNISQLRDRLGDTPEVIGLTGHYHNLLRQWAL
ncbi:MAG TPA: Fe2+-dependent dioxygenase [Limnobacter sp.]|uniref:Fe2+-dependent dioxygenase n=1 Tax=Limnobacter sp. TaxID=2003368 RepID=UPI002E2FC96A|nr:Fe2+-dependent dioxygenase [Limnobacter sp.]HEX5484807.1 Fe2+-dependent dioxygenase [Limnobacter sp.]